MSLSKEIIEILDYLGRKFGIAIDWTSENVVPYIEDLCARYIKFEIYTSIMWIVLCVGIMALAGIIWIICGVILIINAFLNIIWIVPASIACRCRRRCSCFLCAY